MKTSFNTEHAQGIINGKYDALESQLENLRVHACSTEQNYDEVCFLFDMLLKLVR